jgi:CheY-like chemotaxis protein
MSEAQTDLRGFRLLVVEDEYILATELTHALEGEGVEVIGPASCVKDALELLATQDKIDGAVLDINLRGHKVYPIAETLRRRSVPFVFTTGYEAWIIPEVYQDVPRLEKPVDTRALARLISKRANETSGKT